jgi:HEPN domain-containing protein
MSSFDDSLFLKRRAQSFLENAKRNLEENNIDLAAFSVEQSVQLFLKFILFQKKGDYPKTHSLKVLFKEISNFIPEFKKLFEDNLQLIGNLESAYIGARYLPMIFLDEEVRMMINFAEKVKRLVEKHERK